MNPASSFVGVRVVPQQKRAFECPASRTVELRKSRNWEIRLTESESYAGLRHVIRVPMSQFAYL